MSNQPMNSQSTSSQPMNTRSLSSPPRRIRIIGAVAAGTSAAAKARRNDEEAEIVIYELDEFISYSGCGLPYYIGGAVEKLSDLTPRDPAFFRSKYAVDIRIRHQVMSIDREGKTLLVRNLADGSEFTDPYDTLVIATGATAVVPPIPGVDRKHVFTLRTPGDARAIRSFLEAEKPAAAAVIGSGFIGLEMVENLVRAGLKATVVELLPRVCPFLDPDMSPHLQQYLEKQGVTVRTGLAATEITAGSVVLANGERIAADLVIVAVGIRPNVALARSIGVTLGPTGAIAVNERMQTNVPGIYACGDCAESFSIVDGRPLYRPLGSTANKMGRIAGDALTGGPLTHRGIAGTAIFRVFEMALAAAGLSEREARESGYDVVVSHNIKPNRPEYFGGREMVIKSIADRRTEKLLGVQIVGYEGVDKRIDVLVTAMTAGLKASDLFHLDLAYAPPFATTKDPVIYTGMILDNAINRGRALLTAEELMAATPGTVQVVDARIVKQYEAGHIDGAASVPVETLRDHMDELDREKPVLTYCNKGTTGNAAQNILLNHGFRKVYNLSGGFTQYKAAKAKAKTESAAKAGAAKVEAGKPDAGQATAEKDDGTAQAAMKDKPAKD